MFHSFQEVSARIDVAIRQSLPNRALPIDLALAMAREGIVPMRAAVALSLTAATGAVELAAALELMYLAVHRLHHQLDHERRDGLGMGVAADVLVGDYLSTGAFRLLVQCANMAVMGVISHAVQRSCEAELVALLAAPAFGQNAMAELVRCTEPLGEAAGRAGAILDCCDDDMVALAGRFGRNACVAAALRHADAADDGFATAATAALRQAEADAEQIYACTMNEGPRRVCAALRDVQPALANG